jgi:hypothetical protein
MTQAFNLAQLANNLNTSGQLDATDGLNGLVANANLASSGTASSTTYLRGDRTWASIGNVGKVLQAVQVTKTDTQGINVGGWTAITGLSLNITPSGTGSRILILGQVQVGGSEIISQDSGLGIYRGSTLVLQGDGSGSRTRATVGGGTRSRYEISSNTIMYIDSPSTTSSTNYNIQIFRVPSPDGTVYINREWDDGDSTGSFRTTSSLIAIEIGA